MFIAATSQRAIVTLIGSFELNEKVIPWLLSAGCLGPALSWDRRIEMMPPDSWLVLDKRDWSIAVKSNPIAFTPSRQSESQHEQQLHEAMASTFETLDIDFSKWILPLSGGYDSRGILCLIRDAGKNIGNLQTVTWGLASRRSHQKNDAYVAKRLADAMGVANKYYHTDLTGEPIDKVINRFLLLGEGRIDYLSGYMDGFAMWKNFFEQGVQGEIRGDEGFGWNKLWVPLFAAARQTRFSLGCPLCSDFRNLKDYVAYGSAAQKLPVNLQRARQESLSTYRDRLYHQYRLPTIASAWGDFHLSYMEQAKPLLSRRILQSVRRLPDGPRTDKALFRKIVASISPPVEFATSTAIASPKQILRERAMVALLKDELSSVDAREIFSTDFLDSVLRNVAIGQSEHPNCNHICTEQRRFSWVLMLMFWHSGYSS